MGGWRRRWPRPVGALALVLALATGCTVRACRSWCPPPRPPGRWYATTTTAGPSVRGTTVAARAFTLARGWSGGPVRPAGPGLLAVALRQVGELDAEGQPPAGVPAAEGAAALRPPGGAVAAGAAPPAPVPHRRLPVGAGVAGIRARPTTRAGSVVLIDIRPRGVATVTADRAWMRFDVTELYRTWAEGGPFPSQQRTVEPGTPLVMDVRPDSFAEPYFEVRFALLDRDAGTARRSAALDGGPGLLSLPGWQPPLRGRPRRPPSGRRQRPGPLVRCRRGGLLGGRLTSARAAGAEPPLR